MIVCGWSSSALHVLGNKTNTSLGITQVINGLPNESLGIDIEASALRIVNMRSYNNVAIQIILSLHRLSIVSLSF